MDVKKYKNTTSTEYEEQKAFVEYLRLKGLKHTSIPNSTYTKSWQQKAKNTAQGLCAGFPDMIILFPNKMLCIEMKRIKGGVVSENQQEWIDAINAVGGNVEAIVCYGANDAKNAVERILAS